MPLSGAWIETGNICQACISSESVMRVKQCSCCSPTARGRGLGNKGGLDYGSLVPTLMPSAPEGIIFPRCHTLDYNLVVKEAHGKWIILRTLTASERISFLRPNLDAAIWKADVFIVKGGDWLPWVYNCASKTLFFSLSVRLCDCCRCAGSGSTGPWSHSALASLQQRDLLSHNLISRL